MSIEAIGIDSKCVHCGKTISPATLDNIWYSAGRPCCSRACKRAEDAKLPQPPEVVTVEDIEFEAGGIA